jgi:hypothetical protein
MQNELYYFVDILIFEIRRFTLMKFILSGKILAIALLSIIMLSSCTTPKQTANSTLTPSEQLNPDMRITSVIKIKSPQMNTSVSCEMLINSGDSLKLSLSGPFGISVADLWATNDKMLIFDNLNGNAYTGTPSTENIEKALQFSISLQELIQKVRQSVYALKPPSPLNPISQEIKDNENKDKTGIMGYPSIKIQSQDKQSSVIIIPKEASYELVTLNIFPEIPENMTLINLDDIE